MPQTNAWAPNTTIVASATAGDVVSASDRWVNVSISRPDAHDVGQREPALQPAVRGDPDDRRRSAMAVVSRPNPTSSMPSRSLAYSTSTDHAAPKVTLNAKIVSASVRIGGCADEPADALDHVRSQAATRSRRSVARGCVTTREIEERAEREAGGVRRERQRHADREQERADRRRHQLVREQERALHPGVGDAEVLAGHEARHQRAAGRVGERLGRPEDEQRDAGRPRC